DPRPEHREDRQRQRERVQRGESTEAADHERALARMPSHASAATPASAGMARRYAPTYQSGVVGWNDGSHPLGLAPKIASRSSWSLSSKAVLSAVVGHAAYASVRATPRPKSIAGKPTHK